LYSYFDHWYPTRLCLWRVLAVILPRNVQFWKETGLKASHVYSHAYSIRARSSKFRRLVGVLFSSGCIKIPVTVLFSLDTDGIEFVKAVVKPLFNVSLEIISLPLMSSRSVTLSFSSEARLVRNNSSPEIIRANVAFFGCYNVYRGSWSINNKLLMYTLRVRLRSVHVIQERREHVPCIRSRECKNRFQNLLIATEKQIVDKLSRTSFAH